MRLLACSFSLALAVIGCGSVNNLPDASGGDDTPDAAGGPDARTTGTITVTVVADYNDLDSGGAQLPLGVPLLGADVYFIEPDGASHKVTTGGDGVARSPDVRAGTSALVVRHQSATQYTVQAFLALPPEVSLTAGPAIPPVYNYSTIGQMLVTYTAMPGATNYSLDLACWSSYSYLTNAFDVTLRDPCDRTDRTLVVTARDDSGTLRGFSVRNADFTPGNPIAMPGFQTASNFVANVSGLPSLVTDVYIYGTYYDAVDRVASFSAYGVPTGGSAVVQSPTAVAGDSLTLYTQFYGSGPDSLTANRYMRRLASTPITGAIDGGNLLPFTTNPTFDRPTATVSWIESGTTNVADIVIARGSWYFNATSTNVNFTIIGPHVGHQFTLPELPAELAAIAPAGADSAYPYEVFLVDDTAAPGYEALVPSADANSRQLNYDVYTGSDETWVSGGGIID